MSEEPRDDSAVIRDFYERNPLAAFAPLTDLQVKSLGDVASVIVQKLDDSFLGGSNVHGKHLNETYALLWLWVLGVYEVLRTMAQAKNCFVQDLAEKIDIEKRCFAKLRMPLAKHEFVNRGGPSGLYGLLSGIDTSEKDVSFSFNDEKFSARGMISRFSSFFAELRLEQITARSPQADAQQGAPADSQPAAPRRPESG